MSLIDPYLVLSVLNNALYLTVGSVVGKVCAVSICCHLNG